MTSSSLPKLPGLPGLHARNIYCIGRNYDAHAKELNNPVPTRPVLFIKPLASLSFDGVILIPPFIREPHYETELVVAIGKEGKNIETDDALSHVAGYGLGIDVTARDIQHKLKKQSHPWFLAKGLDTFAQVSSFIPADAVDDPQKITFTMSLNGKKRQTGNTSMMVFPIIEQIAYLSRFVTLQPGDLIFTGTPEGVGLLKNGDLIQAELMSGEITFDVRVKGII